MTVMQEIKDAGKAIIDGGATTTIGSLAAVDRLQELNLGKRGRTQLTVDTSTRPSFKFGNDGSTRSLSTAGLGMTLDQAAEAKMQIAVHDCCDQPVLMGIQTLRALGAVIDFESDEMILKKINPSKVLALERAANGHQLFPLTDDPYDRARVRGTPFHSLHDSTKVASPDE